MGIGPNLCSSKSLGKEDKDKTNVNNINHIDVLNEQLLDTNVSYIIIGFSANFNSLFTSNTYHISLFLYSRYDSKRGIIMEFAKFEKNDDNPEVKFANEEQGGLRYYNSTRPAFINNLCTVGNINISLEKNYYFREILNKCCEDRKWTKNEYWLLFNNCQNFASDAMKKLNITFSLSDFYLHLTENVISY